MDKSTKILIGLVTIYSAILVASNAGGAKMIALPFGLSASAVVFSYAISFLVTDIIGEVYGKKAAKFAVKMGLISIFLSVMFFTIAIAAPGAAFWDAQEAYVKTLGITLRLFGSGMLAYLMSQFIDVWIFHKIKKITKGKHMWLRNNLSTMFSQLIDTAIFMTFAFYGMAPLLPLIIGQYLLKLIIAAIDTPIMYVIVYWVKKNKGIEN